MARRQDRSGPSGSRRARTGSLSGLPVGPVPTSLATAELQAHDSGVLLLLDGTESSWIDLRDPAHLDFEYHQQMDAALSALHGPGGAVRAVHLGGAACALARAWDASRPGSTQLAVELDAVLAQRVRQWFELPRAPRLRIRVGDAAAEVPRLRAGEWDVVVRDVFAAGAVPGACLSRDFAAGCLRALAPGGLYLANTSSTPRRTAGADLEAARGVFGGVMVLADPAVARGKRRGNLVIVARSAPFDESAARAVDLAVRRLPLPVRAWAADDPALPRP